MGCRLRYLGAALMVLTYHVIVDTSIAVAGTDQPASVAEVTGPVPGTETTQERWAELEKRVAAKWGALIRGDFEAAYAFASPEYRRLYSLDSFKSKFGGKVRWQRIEIVKVDFKGDDAATVSFNLYFVYHPPQAEESLDMRTYNQESWVRSGGQWWFLVES